MRFASLSRIFDICDINMDRIWIYSSFRQRIFSFLSALSAFCERGKDLEVCKRVRRAKQGKYNGILPGGRKEDDVRWSFMHVYFMCLSVSSTLDLRRKGLVKGDL